ncbi:uncharacterized protein LOC134276894 [Saccostrea cucullata]|uniref:uncharacterized protein LOC134276894 n=1 Tax=Saccostrea cuccullata TaxID=36930 RepID=UPI002ED15C96
MYKVHVFIGVLTCICQTATNGSETWFEAREACRSHNLTLQTNEIVGNATYWTGRYKKLSRWIHLLGCYSDQSFNESEKFHMPHRSVGLCEGICSSLNNLRHFAVKGSTCICLIGFVSTTHLTPKACDLSCDTDTRQPFANECGGSSAYNLYVSGMLNIACCQFICTWYGERRNQHI